MNAPSGPSTSSRSPSRALSQILRHQTTRDDPHQEFHLRQIAGRRAHRVRPPLLGAGHFDSHVLAGMEGNAGAALQRERKFRNRRYRPFDAGHAGFEIAALFSIDQRARVMQAHHARRERVRTAEQALALGDFSGDKRERAVARHLEPPAHQLPDTGRAASGTALVNQRNALAQCRVEHEFVGAGVDLFFDAILETQGHAMSIRDGGRRRGTGFGGHRCERFGVILRCAARCARAAPGYRG